MFRSRLKGKLQNEKAYLHSHRSKGTGLCSRSTSTEAPTVCNSPAEVLLQVKEDASFSLVQQLAEVVTL